VVAVKAAASDGVVWLPDGTRVAFLPPQQPYGEIAQPALVREEA
jgi:hypothetical protein